MSEKRKPLTSFLSGFVLGILSVILIQKLFTQVFDTISYGNNEFENMYDLSKKDFEDALIQSKNKEMPIVDLSSKTVFSWDYVYMFGGYTSPKTLDSVVGNSWRENCYTEIQILEATLFVFTSNGVVVHCMDVRENFLIPKQESYNGIPFVDAQFVINENNQFVWIYDN